MGSVFNWFCGLCALGLAWFVAHLFHGVTRSINEGNRIIKADTNADIVSGNDESQPVTAHADKPNLYRVGLECILAGEFPEDEADKETVHNTQLDFSAESMQVMVDYENVAPDDEEPFGIWLSGHGYGEQMNERK